MLRRRYSMFYSICHASTILKKPYPRRFCVAGVVVFSVVGANTSSHSEGRTDQQTLSESCTIRPLCIEPSTSLAQPATSLRVPLTSSLDNLSGIKIPLSPHRKLYPVMAHQDDKDSDGEPLPQDEKIGTDADTDSDFNWEHVEIDEDSDGEPLSQDEGRGADEDVDADADREGDWEDVETDRDSDRGNQHVSQDDEIGSPSK